MLLLFFLLIFPKKASDKILETNIEIKCYPLIPKSLISSRLVEKNVTANIMAE